MKLKIDNSSVSTLFSLVQNVSEVKIAIESQETILVQVEIEMKELNGESDAIDREVARKAQLLREGSQDGLKELLHLQWLQQESRKKIANAELKLAGIRTSLSLLDDELIALQKQIDAVLQGHKA